MQLKLPYKQKMAIVKEILAKNLKKRLGITQPELAERAGLSTHYLGMIEIARNFPRPLICLNVWRRHWA
jgi:predicted transcriptional regulator